MFLAIQALHAQSAQIKAEIWRLEELESNAILKKDTAVLKRLWASDFTRETPMNRVLMIGKKAIADYSYFSRVNYTYGK